MQSPKTTVRDRLIGKDLIGFDTRAGVVRAPRVKAGTEAKPGARPARRDASR